MAMEIICAWCDTKQGEKEGGEGVTHTCCPDCLLKQFPVPEVDTQMLLDIRTAGCGMTVHQIAGLETGYCGFCEVYHKHTDVYAKVAYAVKWVKERDKLKELHRKARRGRLKRTTPARYWRKP